MASVNASTVTLTSHCLCKANIFTTQILKSELPLPTAPICHCWSCRHVTGCLYTAHVRWPEPREKVDTSKLKAFAFTRGSNLLFCPTCSTPIFWESPKEPSRPLRVNTGTLVNDEAILVKFMKQNFIGDTADGGASVWLQLANEGESERARFKPRADGDAGGEVVSDDWPPAESLAGFEKKTGESVAIRCKCRGVDLVLKRGSYDRVAKDQLPWNVDPYTHKLSTVLCGCDSCRLQGGTDVFYWASVAMEHLSAAQTDAPFPTSKQELKESVDRRDPAIGSLAYYTSATKAGVVRFFCNTCSATVFFSEKERPGSLDVSVGLLDAPEGARAEGFLSWAFGEIDFKQDANGGWRAQHFDAVEKDSEKWRIARGYPKNWKRLGEEKRE